MNSSRRNPPIMMDYLSMEGRPSTSSSSSSSTLTSISITNDLLVDMECPVCTEYLHPPIRQCITGHSMCDSCFVRLTNCPTCRCPKGPSRNFSLEKLHAKLQFPCKNRFDGCNFIENGTRIKAHEEFCQYARVGCPLNVINDCLWYGPEKNVITHCKLKHPRNVFVTNIQRLTCANFKLFDVSTTFYILIKAYDELFRCAWGINIDNGIMKWAVYYLGPQHRARHYSFAVEFANYYESALMPEKVVLRGPVHPATDTVDTFALENCLLTHYDMVSRFCRDDDLIYTIRIIKTNLELEPNNFMF